MIDQALFRRILLINSPEDAAECYDLINPLTKYRVKHLRALLAQCMNYSLPIPEEFINNIRPKVKRFCLSCCVERDGLEYLKYFLSLGWVDELYHVTRYPTDMQYCPNILQYCLDNNVPFGRYEMQISNPACIEILEKFNVSYENIKDTFEIYGKFHPQECNFVQRFLPYLEIGDNFVANYRDLIDFMLSCDVENMNSEDALTLRDLFDKGEVFFFLREGEYETIFNKLTEISKLYNTIVPNRSLCISIIPEGRNRRIIFFDCFRGSLKYLTPQQEDFLISDHLNWFKLDLERVIISGKMRLIEAMRRELSAEK